MAGRARTERKHDTSPLGRAIWKGTLTFGLVSVPVRLHRALTRQRVLFHELHDQDEGPIRRREICAIDGAVVPREHIVKGHQIEGGRWITVSRAELRALDPAASRAIAVLEFVNPQEIAPIFYDRTFWLIPDGEAARAYALLGAAMAGMRRAAIARLTMRARQRLCAIAPVARGGGHVLTLSTLHYADEILAADLADPAGASAPPEGRELALAEQLVESLSGRFRPEQYHDEHRARVVAYLRQKAEGGAPPAASEPTPALPPKDLFEALEESVANAARHKTAA